MENENLENVNDTSVDEIENTVDLETETKLEDTSLEDTPSSDSENTSNSDTENEGSSEKTYTESEFQEKVEKAVKSRLSRENKKYTNLINVLSQGMGLKEPKDVGELTNDLTNFYKERGVEISENIPNRLTEREEIILAKADAEEIIDAGEDEINRVANEIYNIPENKRSIREKTVYEALGKYAMQERAKASLIEKGIDTKILEDEGFKKFASKFSTVTPLSDIYDIYKKMDINEIRTRPATTGSTKTMKNSNEIKEYYSEEEASKFTQEELMANPKLLKAIENSIKNWK